MAIKSKTVPQTIPTADPETHVFLTITIGNAQIGGAIVKWAGSDDNLAKGEIENLDLGTASSIKGKKLDVTTNVLDANCSTNGIVVTYFFSNCNPPVVTLNDVVDTDGDIFSFITPINFQ